LNVPVELLGVDDYRSLFIDAGFTNIRDERLLDPTPFRKIILAARFRAARISWAYREAGSLMMSGEVKK